MKLETKKEEETTINTNIEQNKMIKLKIYEIFKRIIDIIVSIIGIVILIPLTVVIWIANIIVKDSGPVFYVHERIGKNGKLFKLYKYRSMVVNADDKLSQYLAKNEDARIEYREYKKLQNDPRVTGVGDIIRKTSIDEFPQFINVLKGEMSLVGPRPYLPREQEDMGESYNEIIKVKPGLTGLWQVNGRSDTTFEYRMQIDQGYIATRTTMLDIKIIIRTILKVFKKEGAK